MPKLASGATPLGSVSPEARPAPKRKCIAIRGVTDWICHICGDHQDSSCPCHMPGGGHVYCQECCVLCTRDSVSPEAQPTPKGAQ